MAPSGSETGNTRNPRVVASLYWFLTWNNYDDDELALFLKKADETCERYVFEKEVGKNGTPHIQGKIKFKKKSRPMETFQKKEIHWEKSKTWKGAEYCCKDGTEIGVDIWIKGWDPVLAPKIYGWQEECEKMILSAKGGRVIWWFYEETGGVGKTDLCRYMVIKHKALVVGGRAQDMKCAIASMKIKPKIIILNISRNGSISYNGIEQVSDGLFFSSKYESEMVIFNKPIIVVFANREPDYSCMSNDRWRVYRIEEQKLVACAPR